MSIFFFTSFISLDRINMRKKMQINYSSLISFKQTTDSKKLAQMSFASNPINAVQNKDCFTKSSLIAPQKLSFGVNAENLSLVNFIQKVNIKQGCEYNKDKNSLDFGLLSKNAGHVELWVYKQPNWKETPDQKNYKEAAVIPLEKVGDNKWVTSLPKDVLKEKGIDIDKDAVFYGYRVWGKEGSNWEYDKNWTPGSDTGFKSHVDDKGNRFNPNKLLTDPEATEISHDPITIGVNEDGYLYATGEGTYKIDTAPFAPKSIFVMPKEENSAEITPKPTRPLTSDVIYETHLKGLTAGHTKETLVKLYNSFVPENKGKPEEQQIKDMIKKIQSSPQEGGWDNNYAGTFKGASYMALYLKLLGQTAIEFLPMQEFQNSEKDNFWKNYWGYMTLSYKAPERNYAFDKAPGGPTREFKEMVNEFHKQDIKVCMDVVYNHTAESDCYKNADGTDINKANLFNLRGIDNTSYYETAADKKHYFDSNGCGANLNAANPIAQQLTTNTLKYWKDEMKVDSLRFDLAPVLGNTRSREHGFWFDSTHNDSLLQKIENLGVRSKTCGQGVDLIAEPWMAKDGGENPQQKGQQIGNFSNNYTEWNDIFRNVIRKSINKVGVEDISPLDLIRVFSGSYDTFKGKNPRSVNFIDCHDGYTMHDLFAYDKRRTYEQGSEGGTDDAGNLSWSQGGDVNLRKQAVRTAQTLLAVSAGTPMIQGGDERYRTTLGNNNTWNIDSALNYIDWGNPAHQAEVNKLREAGKLKFSDKCETRNEDKTHQITEHEKEELTLFTSRLFNFRKDHPSLRPYKYFGGKDHNKINGKDITWLDGDAKELNGSDENDGEYLNNPDKSVLAFRIDSTEFRDTVTSKTDPATSIYVAYNKGTGAFPVTLPEHQLPNKQWFLVADTSMCPNERLNHENIKKSGEEVPVTSDKLICNGRSALILIEKDKETK